MGVLADRVGRKKVIASSVLGPILQLCWILLVCRSIFSVSVRDATPWQAGSPPWHARHGRTSGTRHEYDLGWVGLPPHGQPFVRKRHDIRHGGRLVPSRAEEPILLLPVLHLPRLRAVCPSPRLGDHREESPNSLRRRPCFSAHMLPDPARNARDAQGA